MLIGQTDKQRYKANQKRLQQLYNRRIRTFAWLPTRLADGRVAWLRSVFVAYPICKDRYGEYFRVPFGRNEYYLEGM